MDKLEKIRRRLLAARDEIVLQAQSTTEDRKPVELDQSQVGRLSRMDAMQVQAMAQATEQRRNVEIARINAALTRIDDGEYGYCTKCGDEISSKRLEHDPAVPLCIDCATDSSAPKSA